MKEEISEEESRFEEGCSSITSFHFAKAFLLFVAGGLAWGREGYLFLSLERSG